MSRALGAYGIYHGDLHFSHPLHCPHGSAGLTHQGGRVLSAEEKGEGDFPGGIVRGNVTDHARGEEIVLESGIVNARERGGYASEERHD
jgi:hypothetical protein